MIDSVKRRKENNKNILLDAIDPRSAHNNYFPAKN
jgi:hypothetical protein